MSACLLSIYFSASPAVYAADKEDVIKIDFSSQPLNQAVTELALESGFNIGGNAKLLTNKKAPALKGQYTVEKALDQLLKGSGVTYRFNKANTITLEKAKVAAPQKLNRAKRKQKVAQKSKTETLQLDTVNVSANRIIKYGASSAKSATGINAPLMSTPRSIQVIPEQLIKEQQAQDLKEVLKNVSGVQTIATAGDTLDNFSVRGFVISDIYQDGFALSGNGLKVQTANIEKVEVLKGSAAILYGRSTPGGIINVITKKPEASPFNNITYNFDKFGQRRLQLDSTGPLNESGSVLYRIVGSIEESDTFRKTDDFDRISRDFISPSITWNFDENNTVTTSYEWIDSKQPRNRGNVLVDDGAGNLDVADVSSSRRFGEPGDSSDAIQRTAKIDHNHIFKSDWELDTGFVYQNSSASTLNTNPAAGVGALSPLLPTLSALVAALGTATRGNVQSNGQLVRQSNQFSTDTDSYYGSLQLSGDVEWGVINHRITTGIDYNRRSTQSETNQPFVPANQVLIGPLAGLLGTLNPNSVISELSVIDIFNPVYNQTINPLRPLSETKRTDTQWGLYGQDMITFSEQWKALLGLRVDRFERKSTNTTFLSANGGALSLIAFFPETKSQDVSQNATYEASPNAGLVYQPTKELTLFTSYSESFAPNAQSVNGLTGETENIEPSTGKQYEVGIKGAFLNERLNFNLAYFDITRQNVPAGTESLTGVTRINGEETSQGLEFDANMQFNNGLNLIFNYAYIDAEVSKGSNKGNKAGGVPRNSASLWATYEFFGTLKDLTVGGGAVYRDNSFVDAANTFELDSYTTFDATVGYSMAIDPTRQLYLQLGVKNIADKEYYIAGVNPLAIGIGTPRTAFASVGLDF